MFLLHDGNALSCNCHQPHQRAAGREVEVAECISKRSMTAVSGRKAGFGPFNFFQALSSIFSSFLSFKPPLTTDILLVTIISSLVPLLSPLLKLLASHGTSGIECIHFCGIQSSQPHRRLGQCTWEHHCVCCQQVDCYLGSTWTCSITWRNSAARNWLHQINHITQICLFAFSIVTFMHCGRISRRITSHMVTSRRLNLGKSAHDQISTSRIDICHRCHSFPRQKKLFSVIFVSVRIGCIRWLTQSLVFVTRPISATNIDADR